MLALGLHLYHGVWSMLQTLGANHPRYNTLFHRIALLVALIVTLGNISFPVAVLTGMVGGFLLLDACCGRAEFADAAALQAAERSGTVALRCFEDGIADSATDVDLALIYGIGFPPFRGGALHYIDDFGIDKFVARADELAAQAGPMKALYLPTEKLREMAANGAAFFG